MTRRRNEHLGRARVRSIRIRGAGATPSNVNLIGLLQGSATWDPGSLVDGAGESKDVTVTCAALGDYALASFSNDTVDIILSATVTAANTVTCRLQNETAGTVDLASGTIKALVIKTNTLA
jgi:hypothetical protein